MSVGLLLATAVVAALPSGGVEPQEKAAYDALLAAQALAADKTFFGAACDGAKVEVVSIMPWKIADHPELVVWREKVRVTGCGHSSVENVNVGRVGGTPPWQMTTGLPGETLADITLQETTFPAASAQAKADLPANCQGQKLKDVYVAARPGDVDISPPGVPVSQVHDGHPKVSLPDAAKPMQDKLNLAAAWMEVWPFEACGHDRTLGVAFVPLRDQTASIYLFLPVWQQIEAHGPGARPAPAPAE